MAADLATLADLSHRLEQVALTLASDGQRQPIVTQELEEQATGEREALAISLSYLLRHRSLGTWEDGPSLDVAIDATVAALRRVSPR